jgi:hypothetical protein
MQRESTRFARVPRRKVRESTDLVWEADLSGYERGAHLREGKHRSAYGDPNGHIPKEKRGARCKLREDAGIRLRPTLEQVMTL